VIAATARVQNAQLWMRDADHVRGLKDWVEDRELA
jgi:predicted nucleic acid-binding protein